MIASKHVKTVGLGLSLRLSKGFCYLCIYHDEQIKPLSHFSLSLTKSSRQNYTMKRKRENRPSFAYLAHHSYNYYEPACVIALGGNSQDDAIQEDAFGCTTELSIRFEATSFLSCAAFQQQ